MYVCVSPGGERSAACCSRQRELLPIMCGRYELVVVIGVVVAIFCELHSLCVNFDDVYGESMRFSCWK